MKNFKIKNIQNTIGTFYSKYYSEKGKPSDTINVKATDANLMIEFLFQLIHQQDVLKGALYRYQSRHEAGLLPDTFTYEEAKKVLEDGEQET